MQGLCWSQGCVNLSHPQSVQSTGPAGGAGSEKKPGSRRQRSRGRTLSSRVSHRGALQLVTGGVLTVC